MELFFKPFQLSINDINSNKTYSRAFIVRAFKCALIFPDTQTVDLEEALTKAVPNKDNSIIAEIKSFFNTAKDTAKKLYDFIDTDLPELRSQLNELVKNTKEGAEKVTKLLEKLDTLLKRLGGSDSGGKSGELKEELKSAIKEAIKEGLEEGLEEPTEKILKKLDKILADFNEKADKLLNKQDTQIELLKIIAKNTASKEELAEEVGTFIVALAPAPVNYDTLKQIATDYPNQLSTFFYENNKNKKNGSCVIGKDKMTQTIIVMKESNNEEELSTKLEPIFKKDYKTKKNIIIEIINTEFNKIIQIQSSIKNIEDKAGVNNDTSYADALGGGGGRVESGGGGGGYAKILNILPSKLDNMVRINIITSPVDVELVQDNNNNFVVYSITNKEIIPILPEDVILPEDIILPEDVKLSEDVKLIKAGSKTKKNRPVVPDMEDKKRIKSKRRTIRRGGEGELVVKGQEHDTPDLIENIIISYTLNDLSKKLFDTYELTIETQENYFFNLYAHTFFDDKIIIPGDTAANEKMIINIRDNKEVYTDYIQTLIIANYYNNNDNFTYKNPNVEELDGGQSGGDPTFTDIVSAIMKGITHLHTYIINEGINIVAGGKGSKSIFEVITNTIMYILTLIYQPALGVAVVFGGPTIGLSGSVSAGLGFSLPFSSKIMELIKFIFGILGKIILAFVSNYEYNIEAMAKHTLPFISIYNYDYTDGAIDTPSFYTQIITDHLNTEKNINMNGNTYAFPLKYIENIYIPYSFLQLEEINKGMENFIISKLFSSKVNLSKTKNALLTYKINDFLNNISCDLKGTGFDFNEKSSKSGNTIDASGNTIDASGNIFDAVKQFKQQQKEAYEMYATDGLQAFVTGKESLVVTPYTTGFQLGYDEKTKTPNLDIKININTLDCSPDLNSVVNNNIIPINLSENFSKSVFENLNTSSAVQDQTYWNYFFLPKDNAAAQADAAYSNPAEAAIAMAEVKARLDSAATDNDKAAVKTEASKTIIKNSITQLTDLQNKIKLFGEKKTYEDFVQNIDVDDEDEDDKSFKNIKFKNTLKLLKIIRAGVIFHNNNFMYHPHYIQKIIAPDNIQYEYYLPIVYPLTEDIMYGFCEFLDKKKCKYIWLNNNLDPKILEKQLIMGQILTFPIKQIGTNDDTPICIIISPNHKEGFSFTFNPALISLGLSNTSGDEEQIYGRILRKYGVSGFNGNYDKKIYQYFSGGNKNTSLLTFMASLYTSPTPKNIDISTTNCISCTHGDELSTELIRNPKPVTVFRGVFDMAGYSRTTSKWGSSPTFVTEIFFTIYKAAQQVALVNLVPTSGAIVEAQLHYNKAGVKELDEEQREFVSEFSICGLFEEMQLRLLSNVREINNQYFAKIVENENNTIRRLEEVSFKNKLGREFLTNPVSLEELQTVSKYLSDFLPLDLQFINKAQSTTKQFCIENLKNVDISKVTNSTTTKADLDLIINRIFKTNSTTDLNLNSCLVCKQIVTLPGGGTMIHKKTKRKNYNNKTKRKRNNKTKRKKIIV